MSCLDLTKDPLARRYLKTAMVEVEFTEASGVLETLEGFVHYKIGDALLTGENGERWPVTRIVFDQMYERIPDQSKNCYKKMTGTFVFAKQMPIDFSVLILEGEAKLKGNQGDWLVQHLIGNYGVVADHIFLETYIEIE
jgi:hypothetical protein